jgi:hypothetical protein
MQDGTEEAGVTSAWPQPEGSLEYSGPVDAGEAAGLGGGREGEEQPAAEAGEFPGESGELSGDEAGEFADSQADELAGSRADDFLADEVGEDSGGEPDEQRLGEAGDFPAEQPDGQPLPKTGEPRVDDALDRLNDLAGLPVTEHRAVFEHVHRRLREVLGELDPGPADAP